MKKDFYCFRCGAPCSGKLIIELRKGVYYEFCHNCWIDLLEFRDIKDVRKELKKQKSNKNETFK